MIEDKKRIEKNSTKEEEKRREKNKIKSEIEK